MTKSPQLPPIAKENKLIQAMRMGRGIWEFMEDNQAQFGDAFTVTLPGQGPMVWVSDPAMVKDIFALKPDQYDASLVQIPMDIGEENTVFLNKKAHQDSRKLVIPPLNTNRLKARAGVMHEIVTEHIDSWSVGDEFDMPRLIGDITMDVICYTVFNLRSGEKKERYKYLMLNWLLSACSDTMFAIGSLYGAKKFRQRMNAAYVKRTERNDYGDGKKGFFPWKQPLDLKVQLAELMRQDIREIREENDETRTDMFSILARATYENSELLSEERIISEAIGLLVGGHETSAATSAWYSLWLLKNPNVVTKMREEVMQSINEEGKFDPLKIAELPYQSACLSESQRLTPSAVGMIRWLTEDTQIGSLYLPKGTAVLPCTYLTHRRKDIYGKDANEYRPERWLGDKKFSPSEYFPFGGGRRACIGMNQARQQIRIIFAEFARRVEFDSIHATQTEWPVPRQIGGQTEPDGGVKVRIKSIKPATEGYPQIQLSKSA